MALPLAADDMFGNYWWYSFNTNVCFTTHLQGRDQILLLGALSSIGTLECQAERAGMVIQITLENVAAKAQSRFDEILTDAAWIQIEDFGGTHNWILSIKHAFTQHGSYIRAYLHRLWVGRRVGISFSMSHFRN
jgi:hypothetical protein